MNDSQQLKRGPVAPFNPNPNWPSGYFQVLEELGVDERRQPFYAHWVRQFFRRQQKRKSRRDLSGGHPLKGESREKTPLPPKKVLFFAWLEPHHQYGLV